MAWGIPFLDKLFGIGEKVVDRLVPDKNKRAEEAHEIANKQADITLEGERARNYFTPRSIAIYCLLLPMVYSFVIRPFAIAFGLDLPLVDAGPALKMLIGMFGLSAE